MKRFAICLVLLALGCSSPDSKLNSNPNGNPNNANNANNVNANPNNLNISTNAIAGPFVDTNDFDQTCEWDSECQMVWAGDICGCGSICGDAIAASAVDELEAAIAAVDCQGVEPQACPGAACQEQMAVCSSGDCEALAVVQTTTDGYDQSCEGDEDCVIVPTGAICSSCDCGRGSMNHNDVERYLEARGTPDCAPGPSACDCEPANLAWCNAGTCDVGFAG